MSSFSVNLGSIRAFNSVSGAELDLNSTVELSSPLPLTYSHTGVRPLDLLTSREVWVTRGIGCRISIQLLVDEKRPVDEEWRAKTAESLGKVLREAELWEQLNLHVTLSIPSSPSASLDADHQDIIIHIKALNREGVEEASQQDTGSAPQCVSHIRPPYGIPCVELNTLRLKLDFAKGRCPLQRKRLKMDSETGSTAQPEAGSLSGPLVLYCPIPRRGMPWRLPSGIKFLATDSSTVSYLASSGFTSTSTLGQLDEGLTSQLNCTSSSVSGRITDISDNLEILPVPAETPLQRPPTPNRSRILAREDSAGRKRRSEQESVVDEEQEQYIASEKQLELHDMVTLTDAALRSLISYRLLRAPNLRVSKEQLSPSLSAIAPALWSPGYRLAIAQRAPFISMIAREFSSFYKRCQSPIVRQKFLRLSQMPLSPAIPSSYIDLDEASSEILLDDEQQKLKRVIQARLWRLTQRLLYNPNAALSLKPLQLRTEDEGEDTFSLGECERSDGVQPLVTNELSSNPERGSPFDGMVASEEHHLDEIIEGEYHGHGRAIARIRNTFEASGRADYAGFADEYDESDYELSCIGDAEEYAELFPSSNPPHEFERVTEGLDTEEKDDEACDSDMELHEFPDCRGYDADPARPTEDNGLVYESQASEAYDLSSFSDLFDGARSEHNYQVSEDDELTQSNEGKTSDSNTGLLLPTSSPPQYVDNLERTEGSGRPDSEDGIWIDHVSDEDTKFSDLEEDCTGRPQSQPVSSDPDDAFFDPGSDEDAHFPSLGEYHTGHSQGKSASSDPDAAFFDHVSDEDTNFSDLGEDHTGPITGPTSVLGLG